VLSSDASTSLEITDISNNSTADATVTVTGLGVATNVTGPRVVWTGPAADAPFCRTIEPSEDVTFTVSDLCGGDRWWHLYARLCLVGHRCLACSGNKTHPQK